MYVTILTIIGLTDTIIILTPIITGELITLGRLPSIVRSRITPTIIITIIPTLTITPTTRESISTTATTVTFTGDIAATLKIRPSHFEIIMGEGKKICLPPFYFGNLARLEGFEPPACGLEVRYLPFSPNFT